MGLMDKLKQLSPSVTSDQAGQMVEDMVSQALLRRRAHERRWYDNQFFDDGYHFRIISRKTGRVIDTVNRTTGYVERAIPRASRQIRGIANLLQGPEPYPVVYPERIIMEEFGQAQQDPKTGKMIPPPEYLQAIEDAKRRARLQGVWLSTEWEENQDGPNKVTELLIKAALSSVSFLQVYSESRAGKTKICTKIRDAFEVILYGDMNDIDNCPFVTITVPYDLRELKTNPMFDEKKVRQLIADNRYATSEIKDAYMRARYGSKLTTETTDTAMVKETFMQEFLTDANWTQAVKLGEETGAMDGKSKGDLIMRHLFSVAGTAIHDEYVDYDKYPLAPMQLEPGPLYQVPLIERFIPQNKSLDIIVTRLEKWVNTMVVGVYQKRKGENMQVSNFPGGQMIEYEAQPLIQMNQSSVGATPFQVIELIDKYIEEQGASTSVLGKVPSGVKANAAIENLQQQEYANLKIPTLMMKKCIKRIGELMLERAHKDYLEPHEVSYLKDGNPEYFDVVGQSRMDLPKAVNKDLPQGVVPLRKDLKIRIEIEPGLGLTMDGKKSAMQAILDYLIKLNTEMPGTISPEAMQMLVKRFLETFGYGSTEEFMEAVENGVSMGQMSDNQIQQLQIAVAQTLKDVQLVGPQAQKKQEDQQVMTTKFGVLQALKESGLLKDIKQGNPDNRTEEIEDAKDHRADIDDMTRIYKDAPPDVRREIEAALKLTPSESEPISPTQIDTATKIHSMVTGNKQTDLDQKQHEEGSRQFDESQRTARMKTTNGQAKSNA